MVVTEKGNKGFESEDFREMGNEGRGKLIFHKKSYRKLFVSLNHLYT